MTSTLDGEGEVVQTSDVIPTKDAILTALNNFCGTIMQIPPIYSAKSINGVRAYDLARKGEQFELNPKQVTVYKFELLKQIDDKSFEFGITCSAGTYIRSLCRDLAIKLNTVATMTSLVRTQCGNFEIKDSLDFDSLTKEIVEQNLISVETALKDMKQFDMSEQLFDRLLKGLKTNINYPDGEYFAKCKGESIGIVNIADGVIKIKTYLKE